MKFRTLNPAARGLLLASLAVAALFPSCQKEPTDNTTAMVTLVEDAGRIPTLPSRYTDEVAIISETPGQKAKVAIEEGSEYEAIRIETEHKIDYLKSSEDFTLLDPWSGAVWPGALIRGASLINDKVPTPIPLFDGRKPSHVIFEAVSGDFAAGEDTKWGIETPMNPAAVKNAQNRLLAQFLETGTAQKTLVKYHVVKSQSDLVVKTGLNIKAFSAELETNFNVNWNEQKSRILVQLTQNFFTMSVPGFDQGVRGAFTEEITPEILSRYSGPGDPICYVSSVTYGRVFYLLYESEEDLKSLSLSLSARYRDSIGGELSTSMKKVLSEASITMLQYGGNGVEAMKTAFNQEELDNFLINGSKLSVDNVGQPISFKVRHLADGSLVSMRNTLQYSYSDVTFRKADEAEDTEVYFEGFDIVPTTNSGIGLKNGTQIEASVECLRDTHSDKVSLENDGTKAFTTAFNLGSSYRSTKVSGLKVQSVTLQLRGKIRETSSGFFHITKHLEASFDRQITLKYNKDNGRWEVATGSDIISQGGFTIATDRCSYKITPRFSVWRNGILDRFPY